MKTAQLVQSFAGRLEAVGEDVYEARAAFLGDHFDGYVADTFLVRDVGYVCWPAVSDGTFEAYDELLDAERDAVVSLEEDGFDLLADGLSRIVLATPPAYGELVVKLGRCGMGDGFGDGRRANLVEAALSTGVGDDAPIVPSLHTSGRGSFAVYPRVESIGTASAPADGAPAATDDDGSAETVRRWLSERAPWLDVDEALAPENRCIWRNRLRTLDYSHPDTEGPLGVPDHVDAAAVVRQVDERRRAGEKPDVRDGGGFAEQAAGRSESRPRDDPGRSDHG